MVKNYVMVTNLDFKKKKKKRMTNFAQEADITKIIILHQLLLSETSHRRGRYNFLLSTNINLLEFYQFGQQKKTNLYIFFSFLTIKFILYFQKSVIVVDGISNLRKKLNEWNFPFSQCTFHKRQGLLRELILMFIVTVTKTIQI